MPQTPLSIMPPLAAATSRRAALPRVALLALVALATISACSPSARADSDSSLSPTDDPAPLVLTLIKGPGSDDLTLAWTGSEPPFAVHRAADPRVVGDASHRLGETNDRTWIDTPPEAPLHAYLVSSLSCAAAGDIVISELMIDPVALTDTRGEWIEVYNASSRPIDLRGWTLRDASSSHLIDGPAPLVVAPGAHAVLAIDAAEIVACGIGALYDYASVTLNNSGDTIALLHCGTVIDEVVYGADQPGSASGVSPSALDATANDDWSRWCPATTVMTCGDRGTPDAVNEVCP